MNNVIKIMALSFALSLFSQNQAQAGFFDWSVNAGKNDSLLLTSVNENRISFSHNHIWDEIKENIKESYEKEEEPKIEYKIVRESFRQITAYNVGDIYQTDDTPCTGAYSKVNLCDELEKGVRICAANFVPLHTTLRIFTDDNQSFECIVWDRMHSRFSARVDIAMSLSEKTRARQFGKQVLKVQVLEKIDNELVTL